MPACTMVWTYSPGEELLIRFHWAAGNCCYTATCEHCILPKTWFARCTYPPPLSVASLFMNIWFYLLLNRSTLEAEFVYIYKLVSIVFCCFLSEVWFLLFFFKLGSVHLYVWMLGFTNNFLFKLQLLSCKFTRKYSD